MPREQLEPFYRTAALGLRVLDSRAGRARCFGAEADSTWRTFSGDLMDADRLDLIVRDAAARYGAAASPRLVFRLDGLADDEPFGPTWDGPPAGLASSLFRDATASALTDVRRALDAAAALWAIKPSVLPVDVVARVAPATRVVVAGAGAIISVATHFAGRTDLDFADQVLIVADDPAERQLAGLAGLLLDTRHPARLVDTTSADPAALRKSGFSRADLSLISEDASDVTRDAAQALARGLGG